jgi:hypothetical protein
MQKTNSKKPFRINSLKLQVYPSTIIGHNEHFSKVEATFLKQLDFLPQQINQAIQKPFSFSRERFS